MQYRNEGTHVHTYAEKSNNDKKGTLMYDNFFISRLKNFANAKKKKQEEKSNQKLEYSSYSYYGLKYRGW